MSTIFYVPSENGWEDTAASGYYTRLKVEQDYNSTTNRSTFTVTPQFKGQYEWGTFTLTDGSITANGATLVSFQMDGGYYRYTAQFFSSQWSDIYTAYPGYPTSWTFTADHNGYGTCTVLFTDTAYTNGKSFNGSASTSFPGVARTYTLSISTDAHSHVTVTNNGVALSNGDTFTYGSQLAVSFSADAGYALDTHTINGYIVNTTTTYWAYTNISVVATSIALGLLYRYVSGAWKPYFLYLYHNGAWKRYRPYVYSGGQWKAG